VSVVCALITIDRVIHAITKIVFITRVFDFRQDYLKTMPAILHILKELIAKLYCNHWKRD
jgi:hypothetical protein